MNESISILNRFRDVVLPDATDYDFSAPDAKKRYTDDWRELAEVSDAIVKAIVRYLAQPVKSPEARFVRKLLKHLERCLTLGEKTYANWQRTADWLENSKLDAGEIVWTFLGEKTQKEKWSTSEQKAINAETKKCEKLYHAVHRERELLLIELDVIHQTGNA